jgi:thioesterase domain-containing protein
MTETILDWIGAWATQQPCAIALLSPNRSPLSYLLNPAARRGLVADDLALLSELLLDTYVPSHLDAPLILFRAVRRPHYERLDPLRAWKKYARTIDLVDAPGDHWSLVFAPQVQELARRIRAYLDLG